MKNLINKLFFMILVLSMQTFCADFSGGTGDPADPYQITTAAQLNLIRGFSYSISSFILENDIDLVAYQSGSGWLPIGDEVNAFKGNFYGHNHKVTGLKIDTGANYKGLFGIVNGGEIDSLGVAVNITITGEGSNAGGLIGVAQGNCTIKNCYSTGNITSAKNFVGGLVGYCPGSVVISNCYSSVVVQGYSYVGGLVGDVDAGSILNCYSRGSVTGTYLFIGGLIGINGGSTITNCFWDVDASTQAGSDGGTGKSTTEMKTKSTYTGWDNTGTIWKIDLTGVINYGYPFLAWQDAGGTALPVELTSFTSAVNQNSVTLNWSTATEVNNYGFEVERRSVNSKGSTANNWQKVGFVSGNGTINSPKSYFYSDVSLASGRYAYRLKQIDNNGAFKYSQSIELGVNLAPATIGLSQNYPNPFNPSTRISFSVFNTEQAKLIVYNLLGQPVMTLFDGVAIGQQAYQLSFDASKLASGVYFYKLETPSRIDVKRMQLLK
jgi:hypothetical protein